ncbi:hypothetical protein HR12_45040 [Microbacterium sp. SUBG005]|nr:hypothetical protein HR12_45040 [Microbacterium sp. SUBG005]
MQIEYYAFPQFALSDSLLDLSSYGFGDLESDYATPWGSVDFDGKIYGLPQDSGPMALFYNKSVFDQYGIASPPRGTSTTPPPRSCTRPTRPSTSPPTPATPASRPA